MRCLAESLNCSFPFNESGWGPWDSQVPKKHNRTIMKVIQILLALYSKS